MTDGGIAMAFQQQVVAQRKAVIGVLKVVYWPTEKNSSLRDTVGSQIYAINLFMRKCDFATFRKNKIAL